MIEQIAAGTARGTITRSSRRSPAIKRFARQARMDVLKSGRAPNLQNLTTERDMPDNAIGKCR
jgi:hypothetical protein